MNQTYAYGAYSFVIHGIFGTFFVLFGVSSNVLLIFVFLSVRKFRTKLVIQYFLILLCTDILLLINVWTLNHWKIIAAIEQNPNLPITGRRATVKISKVSNFYQIFPIGIAAKF